MTEEKNILELKKVPVHVAMIMDGNGRWAAARGLPRLAGHRAGTENLRRVITASVEFGIKFLTIYAFSTENWGRPQEEVKGLMLILEDVIDKELAELHEQGVQLRHIGHLESLSPKLRKKVLELRKKLLEKKWKKRSKRLFFVLFEVEVPEEYLAVLMCGLYEI